MTHPKVSEFPCVKVMKPIGPSVPTSTFQQVAVPGTLGNSSSGFLLGRNKHILSTAGKYTLVVRYFTKEKRGGGGDSFKDLGNML